MKRTIAGLRKDLQMDRDKYAEMLKIKKSTLVRYEQFKSVPDVNVAIRIMRLSGIENVDEVNWG